MLCADGKVFSCRYKVQIFLFFNSGSTHMYTLVSSACVLRVAEKQKYMIVDLCMKEIQYCIICSVHFNEGVNIERLAGASGLLY